MALHVICGVLVLCYMKCMQKYYVIFVFGICCLFIIRLSGELPCLFTSEESVVDYANNGVTFSEKWDNVSESGMFFYFYY